MTIFLKRKALPSRQNEIMRQADLDNVPDAAEMEKDLGYMEDDIKCIENDARAIEDDAQVLNEEQLEVKSARTKRISKSHETFNNIRSILNMFENIDIQTSNIRSIPLVSASKYGKTLSKPKLTQVKTKSPIKRKAETTTRMQEPEKIIKKYSVDTRKLNFQSIKKAYRKRR